MTTILNPQFNCEFEIDDELIAFMASHGFKPWHAGGGGFAWRRDLSFPNGWTPHDLITLGDNELGSWAERDHPGWSVGRYDEECSELIDSPGELTLQEAIDWISTFDPGIPKNA
jgi:hypothetical protein